MKKLALIILCGLLFAIVPVTEVFAAKGKSKKSASKKQPVQSRSRTGAQLETDVRFDNSTVHGRYQTPAEAVARVENEKLMSDLLAVRKHFKDRLQVASGQE